MEPSDAGLANVRTLEQGRAAAEERRLWARFREARDPETFFETWLELQCRAIEGVHAGLLFARSPEAGGFAPVATWPASGRPARHLAAAAERVLKEGRALALQLDPKEAREEESREGERKRRPPQARDRGR